MITYKNTLPATFLRRPNRFIAHVLVNGQEEIAHVPNTGRCKELLVPGATVYLEPSDNPQRKTKFSLRAVEKGDILINMDSQAPHKLLYRTLESGRRPEGFPQEIHALEAEHTYGHSRLDLYFESGKVPTLVEVKGVTLEKDGVALFPDAPTQRGLRHLEELAAATHQGYRAMAVFIIQMDKKHLTHFSPNDQTHPEFAQGLAAAEKQGVQLVAYTCHVTPQSLSLDAPLPLKL